jgi:hypothetical protein
VLIALGVWFQLRTEHGSRGGHVAAARWLTEHARPGEAVLDTRGWATSLSGVKAYDPWHIRQALTDSSLAFLVIGADELTATSRRAATLRAILDYAAEPAVSFRSRTGKASDEVLVYRFHRPESWEGLRP